jgi:hypothetical protein
MYYLLDYNFACPVSTKALLIAVRVSSIPKEWLVLKLHNISKTILSILGPLPCLLISSFIYLTILLSV